MFSWCHHSVIGVDHIKKEKIIHESTNNSNISTSTLMSQSSSSCDFVNISIGARRTLPRKACQWEAEHDYTTSRFLQGMLSEVEINAGLAINSVKGGAMNSRLLRLFT